MFSVLVVLLLVCSTNGNSVDSYLEAYQESHGTTQKTDREYTDQFPYPPSQPEYQYGPPKYSYGPPEPPVHHQNYGPPLVPAYGPPAPPPVYGMPHGMLSLLDKLKFKFDLFTIGKILLKIVLFKKFVSFVAVLCLLLFIPTLKHKVDEAVPDGGDDDDEGRTYGATKNEAGDEFLNNITEFVVGAIDNFSKNYTDDGKCESVYCQTRKIMNGIDNKLSYRKLAEVYSREIQP